MESHLEGILFCNWSVEASLWTALRPAKPLQEDFWKGCKKSLVGVQGFTIFYCETILFSIIISTVAWSPIFD